jgi:translation initiation factor 3 subunit D
MAEPEPGTSALVDLINALPDIAGTWGPPVTSETLLNGVPYAPFSKSDKLGRMADWTDASKDGRDGRGGKQYNRGFRGMSNHKSPHLATPAAFSCFGLPLLSLILLAS